MRYNDRAFPAERKITYPMTDPVIRCVACDGYGWLAADSLDTDDETDGGDVECAWCGGIGYVYRAEGGVDRRIPPADLDVLTAMLEALEVARLREMGYTGEAKQPWRQQIRRDRGDRLSTLGDPEP